MPEIGAALYSTITTRVKKISDVVIERNRLLSYLKDKGRLSFNKGGSDLKGPYRATASAIAGYTNDLGVGGAQTTQPFGEWQFLWRQFIARPFILGFQMERNQNAGSEAKIFSMMKAQLDEVQQSAKARIGRASYAANTTTESADNGTPIHGLEDIIDDDNTFGGIDRSSSANAAWRAQIQSVSNPTQDSDNDGTTNLVAGMDTLYIACSGGKGSDNDTVKDDVATEKEEPDHILTTSTLFNAYKQSLRPQQRYSGRSGSDLTSLMYGQAEVEWDPACTASRMYFLNSEHLDFYCVNSKLLDAKKPIETSSPLGTQYPVTGQHCLFSRAPRYLGAIRVA